MAGRTYLETNSKASATKYLLRVYELDPIYKYNILFLIGQGYQYGSEFEKAIEYYNMYLVQLRENTRRSGEDFTLLKMKYSERFMNARMEWNMLVLREIIL